MGKMNGSKMARGRLVSLDIHYGRSDVVFMLRLCCRQR